MPNPQKARSRYLKSMREAPPAQSSLGKYLAWMGQENPDGAEKLTNDLTQVFTTEEGLRVLKMMENSVLLAGVPDGAPDSALREMNAVRNFVLEIRRIVSHG